MFLKAILMLPYLASNTGFILSIAFEYLLLSLYIVKYKSLYTKDYPNYKQQGRVCFAHQMCC